MKFQGKTYRVQFDFSNRDPDDLDVDVIIKVQDEPGASFKTLTTGVFENGAELQIEANISTELYQRLEYHCECFVEDARREFEDDVEDEETT